MTTSAVQKVRQRLGAQLRRTSTAELNSDFDAPFMALLAKVTPYTMTSPARLFGLYEAATYVLREQVPGDLVECGVWRGGSTMPMAHAVVEAGEPDRQLWLYDTFTGMTEPGKHDPPEAHREYREHRDKGENWAQAPRAEVERNVRSTGIAHDRVVYVEGRVEDTIPKHLPDRIALLRLDTDWYESTAHELANMWPRLARGGVLIIDDYGHFQGARRAVDDFFSAAGHRPLMARLDYTGRMLVKDTD